MHSSADAVLPAYLGVMLHKMLLEYIVRGEDVKEFEAGLEDHQKAKVEGGASVLERAVRDHNVGACAKVSVGLFCWVVEVCGAKCSEDDDTERESIECGNARVVAQREAMAMEGGRGRRLYTSGYCDLGCPTPCAHATGLVALVEV